MRSIIILNKSTFGLLAKAGNYIDLWTWSRYNLLLFYFPKTKGLENQSFLLPDTLFNAYSQSV